MNEQTHCQCTVYTIYICTGFARDDVSVLYILYVSVLVLPGTMSVYCIYYIYICTGVARDDVSVLYMLCVSVLTAALPGTMSASRVCNAIKAKCSGEEVVALLKDCPNPLAEQADFNPLRIEVFVQTLLNLGAKSFSHSFAAIAK